MEIYNNITSKPYSYVIVDNKADTPSRRQKYSETACLIILREQKVQLVSVTKQATKAIDLKEDSVRYYKLTFPKY